MQLLFLVLVSQSVFAIAMDCDGNRYEDNNNGTVSDCRTGLIWLKNANCLVYNQTWDNAQIWAKGLAEGDCDLTDGSSPGDWRLPTKTEFMAMVQSAKKQGFGSLSTPLVLTDETGTNQWTQSHLFINVIASYYWTSTADSSNAAQAWDIRLDNGAFSLNDPNECLVWPVRAGNDGSYKSLLIQ
jgi:hypothetical protein